MIEPKLFTPSYRKPIFVCPHCSIQSSHQWRELFSERNRSLGVGKSHISVPDTEIDTSFCMSCGHYAVWLNSCIIYPEVMMQIEDCHQDTPENVRELFEEAAGVFARSPRSAATLIRLAIERQLAHLGQSGKTINEGIAGLVADGLDSGTVKAFDLVRLIGNSGAHDKLNMADTENTALELFFLLAFITNQTYEKIANLKKIADLHSNLPETSKEAIEKRNLKALGGS